MLFIFKRELIFQKKDPKEKGPLFAAGMNVGCHEIHRILEVPIEVVKRPSTKCRRSTVWEHSRCLEIAFSAPLQITILSLKGAEMRFPAL